jgi:hypothetical protein
MVEAGYVHSCALTGRGAVKCWGYNGWGQFGNGTTTDALVPVETTGLTTAATAITAGTHHTCALNAVGGARCWGQNSYGQLGNGEAGYAVTPQTVVVAACADFTDVDPASAFCGSVDWLRNRNVTQGCTSTNAYCPDDTVIRLAMAAFMNRLGTALTPIVAVQRDAGGPLDPDLVPIVCATTAWTATGFPRRLHVDGVLAGTSAADLGLTIDPVASFDGGTSWYSVASRGQRGFVRASRWGNLRVLGDLDVEAGQTVRFGVRVSRGGLPGTATLSEGTCNLRVRIESRNGAASPF